MSYAQHREPTDGDLIELIAGGDRPAFEELYRRYARAVLGLALRRLGDRGRAEDAAQEAFLAIWRSARTYDSRKGRGAPWLYAVARNAITDGLRRTPEPAADPPDEAATGAGAAGPRGSRVAGVAGASRPRDPSRARASRDRARLLARPVAERDLRLARYTPRDGEDANAECPCATCARARRDDRMTTRPPDFDDLIGNDVEASERARLERVHQALIEAGPPPELSPRLSAPPADSVVPLRRRRRGPASRSSPQRLPSARSRSGSSSPTAAGRPPIA